MTYQKDLRLREATAGEALALAGLVRAAFAEYDGVLNPPSGALRESVETVRERLNRGGAVLAEIDSTPAGVAFYQIDPMGCGTSAACQCYPRTAIAE